MQPRPKKLLRQLRDAIRARYDSYRTKQAYVGQIRSCVLFHGKPHPSDTGAYEVDALPTHLAVAEHVAASTQNQAFRALPFLYRGVLPKDVGLVDPLSPKRRSTWRRVGCLAFQAACPAILVLPASDAEVEILKSSTNRDRAKRKGPPCEGQPRV